MKRWAPLALALAALAGCETDTAPSASSFDLPGDVSFACVELAKDGSPAVFVALEQCRLEDDATDPKTHSLVAFVTQVATGEVAAVDLRDERSLDSSAIVPGFTYVLVGEIPTGIATIEPTSATVPSITFVSAFGSRTIEALDTARFHPDVEDFELDPDVPEADQFVETRVELPEGPTDLVFFPVSGNAAILGYVFAPLPASGTVAQVPVLANGRLDGAALQLLPLDPIPLNALGPAVADEAAPYERICPADRGYDQATAAPVQGGDATVAKPVKLELDLDSSPPVLLVADEVSPVIHRFSLSGAGAAALQGLGVGVPTIDLAVTPPVASTVDDDPLDPATTIAGRYLYAIDATDGSVLALDYTPGSVSFGAVLAVNSGADDPNRIAYREPARAIEVITPELRMARDGASDTPGICDPADAERADEALPTALRGVFLAVGLQNGFVAVVDVWDLEAPCRGGLECANPADANDVEVAIRRHRPRIATFVTDRPVVTGSPSLSFETSPGLLDDEGWPGSGSGPGLAPVECVAELGVQGFPDPEESVDPPLICLRDDPWAGRNQRFVATFDGEIPLARGGDGLLVDAGGGAVRLQAPSARFCEVGVLGADDVVASALGPDDPELGYGGDQLQIIGDLPPDTESDEACAAFDVPEDGDESDRDPILFQVVAASQGELLLSPIGGTDAAAVLACFPHPTAYRVRTRGAYTVTASGEGMRHRVVSASGACRVDTAGFPVVVGDPDTYRNFRAIPQRTFIHPRVAFQITRAGEGRDQPLELEQSSVLVFDVGAYPPKLALDLKATSIIASMRWNPIDDRLYVVDEGNFLVTQIDTDSFSVLESFD